MSVEVHGVGSDGVDAMETMMDERLDMQCRQELDCVGRMNKVREVIYNPIGTKLARNLLSKIVTGPLGDKPLSLGHKDTPTLQEDENQETKKRRPSEELRYQQRSDQQKLDRLKAMKESQNEELDTLRRRRIVQKKLADRRMKSSGHRMFNHRLYVNPTSKQRAGSSSILITGEGEDDVRSAEFVRQESQMYINNFLRDPSKNRRVLQRLNSTQIQSIQAIEIKKANVKNFPYAPPVDRDMPHKSSGDTMPKKHSIKVKMLSKASVLKNKLTASLRSKKQSEDDHPPSTSKLSSLGRKLKGGITKTGKRKSRMTRHASSSLDDLMDDVHVKPRKKSAERRKLYSTHKLSTKALEEQVLNDVSHTKRRLHIPRNPPKQQTQQLTSPPGVSANWPPLPSSGSHDMPVKSHDLQDASHDLEVASGPPLPTLRQQSSSQTESIDDKTELLLMANEEVQSEGSYIGNGFSSHDDHMTSLPPPVTTLKEIEQNDEDGYMSESESGTFSDGDDNVRSEKSTDKQSNCFRVCEDGDALDNKDDDDLESPHSVESQHNEGNDRVADLPAPRSQKKSYSHDNNRTTVDKASPTALPRKRYFSSPQIFNSQAPLCDRPTPRGYYTPATVEVNPFSVDFERATHQNLSLNKQEVEEVTSNSTLEATVSTYTRQISTDFVDFVPSESGRLEVVETETQITTRHSCSRRVNQVLEPSLSMEPGHGIPAPDMEPRNGIPARAFRDPLFLQFIKKLDNEPTKSDYISYKLRTIGDQIDQQYDNQLNRAMDDMFWETIKTPAALQSLSNAVSYESFSNASKHLLVEGQKIQDSIFLITCFGRRLAEMLPNLGDRVNDFTHLVVDAYASDYLLGIGGWGRLVECYEQVETTPHMDYEDYPDTGFSIGLNMYDDPTPSSTHQANSFDDPLPNHPNIIQITPPQTCLHDQQSFQPRPTLNRLRRVISVEVLFTEADSTEHAQNSLHDNPRDRKRSLTRSLSAGSIEVSSIQCQHRILNSNVLSPSPTKLVSEQFRQEEINFEERSLRYSRRGSVASVCSNASTIRLVGVDLTGGGVVLPGNGRPGLHPNVPNGQYLDLHFDTPAHSRRGTLNGPPSEDQPSVQTVSQTHSLAAPIIAGVIAVGIVGALGLYYYRRK